MKKQTNSHPQREARTGILTTLISLLLIMSSPAFAQDDPVDINAENEIKQKETIKYEPFDMVHPETGEPISSDTMLTLPNGKTMKAGRYYQLLNDYQKSLNKKGHTLKGNKKLGTVVRVLHAFDKYREQKKESEEDLQEIDEYIMAVIEEPEKLVDDVSGMAAESFVDYLKDLYKEAINTGSKVRRINVERPSPRVITESLDKMQSISHKEWALIQGDESKFAVNAKATMDLEGNLAKVQGTVKSDADVIVWGKRKNIIKSKFYGLGNSMGQSKASAAVEVFGKKIISKTWATKIIKAKKEKKPAPNVNCPHAIIAMREGTKFRFSVGPVPMKGEVGAAGCVGYDWALGIQDKKGAFGALAYADLAGYAEVGADYEIIEAGIGGELVVLNERLSLNARLGLDVEPVTKKMQIITEVNATNKITILSGDLYAFVRATVPTLAAPPYEEREWTWDIYSWEGIDTGGEKTLYSYKRIVDELGTSLQGAPNKGDYNDMNVDLNLQLSLGDTLASIDEKSDHIENEANRVVNNHTELRNEISTWLDTLE